MNHRIKQLALEAFQSINDIASEGIADRHTFDQAWFQSYNQKFAELLIRECVKEIEFQYGGGSDQPMDNEWDRAIECVSSMVKYRFGVEE